MQTDAGSVGPMQEDDSTPLPFSDSYTQVPSREMGHESEHVAVLYMVAARSTTFAAGLDEKLHDALVV